MLQDQRNHLRYRFVYSIEYVMRSQGANEIFTGITTDISNSGMGLYTRNALTEGQEIVIKSILPVYFDSAIVRWSEHVDESSFKIGLEFRK